MKAADLIDYVASEAGVAKTAPAEAVEAVFCRHGRCRRRRANRSIFRVLASFKVKDSPARQGRNPATGETDPKSQHPGSSASPRRSR